MPTEPAYPAVGRLSTIPSVRPYGPSPASRYRQFASVSPWPLVPDRYMCRAGRTRSMRSRFPLPGTRTTSRGAVDSTPPKRTRGGRRLHRRCASAASRRGRIACRLRRDASRRRTGRDQRAVDVRAVLSNAGCGCTHDPHRLPGRPERGAFDGPPKAGRMPTNTERPRGRRSSASARAFPRSSGRQDGRQERARPAPRPAGARDHLYAQGSIITRSTSNGAPCSR